MLLDEEEDTREDAVRAFWSALFEPMLNESRQFTPVQLGELLQLILSLSRARPGVVPYKSNKMCRLSPLRKK